MRILFILMLVGIASCLPTSTRRSPSDYFHYRWLEISLKYESDVGFKLAADQVAHHTNDVQSKYAWNCATFGAAREPLTVHELTPPDIKIIGAMGDSITAGNGIQDGSLLETAIEDRGKSWSVGIQDTVHQIMTIPNILTEYNADLVGGSSGIGPVWLPNARLNVAEPGAKSDDMFTQANLLIERLTGNIDPVAYENDWKLVTMLIGGNDYCDQCHGDDYRAEDYTRRIQEGLDLLHQTVPRMFVNVAPMLDMTPLRHMSRGFLCSYMQKEFCDCVIKREWRDETRPLQLEYYEHLKTLIDSGRYDTRDDFTVVLQPMFVNQGFPQDGNGNYDDTWLGADCFHPSAKTHEFMTVSLWNTMFEREGRKSLSQFGKPDIYCPVQGETFKTRLNSAVSSQKEVEVAINESIPAAAANHGNRHQASEGIARHPGHP